MTDKKKVGDMSSYSGPNWVYDMLGMPFFWQGGADELRRAAGLVWCGVQQDFWEVKRVASEDYDPEKDAPLQHPPSVMSCFVFLAALSIENLFKGLIVIDHPEYVEQGKLRGDVITKHDLILLANEARVTLSDEERDLCELGSSAIVSWGRYPIPRNVSEMKSKITVNERICQVFDELFIRMSECITNRFKKRPRC